MGLFKNEERTLCYYLSPIVEWTTSWDSNAEDAVEFCHGIYVALLGDLKATFN